MKRVVSSLLSTLTDPSCPDVDGLFGGPMLERVHGEVGDELSERPLPEC